MNPVWILPALLGLPPQALAPGTPVEARIQALSQAKDWAGLADYFETLSPKDRTVRHSAWLQALNRAQRWPRLLEVSEAVLALEDPAQPPRLTPARLMRAQALSQLQRHPEALKAHAEIGRLGWADGYSNACAEARLAQDWPALLESSEALLAKVPEDPKALAWKGEALARLDRFSEAEPLLRQALARDPAQPYAWSNQARCANERKAWQEALEACDRALALEPALLEARFNRGRACFELKRYAEARADFQAALALLPGDPTLLSNLHQAQRYADAESKAKKNKK